MAPLEGGSGFVWPLALQVEDLIGACTAADHVAESFTERLQLPKDEDIDQISESIIRDRLKSRQGPVAEPASQLGMAGHLVGASPFADVAPETVARGPRTGSPRQGTRKPALRRESGNPA